MTKNNKGSIPSCLYSHGKPPKCEVFLKNKNVKKLDKINTKLTLSQQGGPNMDPLTFPAIASRRSGRSR